MQAAHRFEGDPTERWTIQLPRVSRCFKKLVAPSQHSSRLRRLHYALFDHDPSQTGSRDKMAPIAVSPRAAPAVPAAKKVDKKSNARSGKEGQVKFSTFDVTEQVLYRSADASCYALVNLKPIVPGHILVIPATPYHRLSEVPPQMRGNLFQSVQEISRGLEKIFQADAVTISVQDGEAAVRLFLTFTFIFFHARRVTSSQVISSTST